MAAQPIGVARDDTTPIPRQSTFYGRGQNPVSQDLPSLRLARGNTATTPETLLSTDPSIVPSQFDLVLTKNNKTVLTIAEPKRNRNNSHVKFVASQAYLICGQQPCDLHHLRFAQPRAIGMRVSDEFTVPLCRGHHRQLHQARSELAWWKDRGIDAQEVAKELWQCRRSKQSKTGAQP